MRTILLAVIALLAALEGRAGDFSRGAAGTSGSQFLTFDTSARGIAMAGAYVTASDDAIVTLRGDATVQATDRVRVVDLRALAAG